MPVVSAPCSCQPDCLVCGRGDVPPHDCAIHVLLESMVFQEQMLYGEPTEARLEETLQNGKEYLPGAMHMTDQNSFRIIVNGLQPPEIIDLHTDTEQRIGELLTKVLPDHYSPDILRVRAFARSEPKDVSSDYVEQKASKGKGAFTQALWTLYAKSRLYRLAYKAWKRQGPQNLTTWILLAQAVLDGCYAEKWPDTVFQVPDVCSICPMHWPEKTHCALEFHLQCLLQHLDVSNTCPLCRAHNPLRTS
ncbi:uncharacterized protein TNCV_2528471 [Trichonephila clavipes]|nr:uncharacterized protein TNCV_2528471 [Trichonephila clavipes]